jgi:hypothetical protein
MEAGYMRGIFTTMCAALGTKYQKPAVEATGKQTMEWMVAHSTASDDSLSTYLRSIGVPKAKLAKAFEILSKQQAFHDDSSENPSGIDASRRERKVSEESSLAIDFMEIYVDKMKLIDGFKNYLIACERKFRDSSQTFLSPYVTLVQSSGYGKTRLIREVANQLITLYVCFRDYGSTGYPPRTSKAIDTLFHGLETKERAAYVHELKRRICFCARNALTMKSKLLGSDDQSLDPEEQALFPSERNHKVWDCHPTKIVKFQRTSDLVVLAFDEARACLNVVKETGVSQFRLIRQALREISTDKATSALRIIGVFVDTSSRIQDFALNIDDDPSARKVAQTKEMDFKKLKLFHPFILCGTCDIHFKSSPQTITSLIASKQYLRVGRPLVTQGDDSDDGNNNFGFLQRKLFGGGESPTGSAALGIILCRVSAFVCPRHCVASDLVANHMATLLACDKERQGTLSTFVAEPRLAIAASQLWSDDEIFSDQCIPALQNALMSGALSEGIRGEIVAQILLLLACDSACRDAGQDPGSCVSLRAVLRRLLPSSAGDKLLKTVLPDHFKDTKIACCQFLHVAHGFTEKTFFELAERHCGASLREGQRGADLVIPILGSGGPGYLIVQVKNLISCQKGCAESRMVCTCLLPSYVFDDKRMCADYLSTLDKNSVCLFMQVGARTPSASVVEMPDGLPHALEIFGMMPRCLDHRIRHSNAIGMLVHGKVDLQGYISKNASVDPNPDAGGVRARRAWSFLIASHKQDATKAPKVLHSNCCYLEQHHSQPKNAAVAEGQWLGSWGMARNGAVVVQLFEGNGCARRNGDQKGLRLR